ncbi:MAG: Gfo/Idh/MocA family oxidoreductase [FCB group bacterium]|nr:Gfo/Idh/MocA family oxidoreductase [FCB group bacterium]
MKNTISRRGFLATAAATVASASVARRASANETIQVGCIGLGTRGTQLVDALSQRGGVRVVAACDIFEPRKARMRDVRVLHDWNEIIARSDVDAVVIATPDHWHMPMAVAAMEAGKDVYCERPMALDAAQAKVFRDVARRTGRVVQIGVQETSEGQWHTAREDVLEPGRLGPVRWSQGSYSPVAAPAAPRREEAAPRNLDWQAFLGPAAGRGFEAERYFEWRKFWDYSGGIATDLHYHKLTPLLLALGAEYPERVSAAGGVYVRDGREVPDAFVMTAEYAGGHTIVLASSIATRQELPAVIRGRDASLYAEGSRLRIVPEEGDGAEAVLPVKPMPDHLDDWLTCIRTRNKPVCNEELGYRAMVAVSMGVQAYREGKTLRWDLAQHTALPDSPRVLA